MDDQTVADRYSADDHDTHSNISPGAEPGSTAVHSSGEEGDWQRLQKAIGGLLGHAIPKKKQR